jgi:hypothetical protein
VFEQAYEAIETLPRVEPPLVRCWVSLRRLRVEDVFSSEEARAVRARGRPARIRWAALQEGRVFEFADIAEEASDEFEDSSIQAWHS